VKLSRILFKLATLLSLILCLASLGLAVRSFYRADEFAMEHQKKWKLDTNSGVFEFGVLTQFPTKSLANFSVKVLAPAGPAQPVSDSLHFHHYDSVPHRFPRAYRIRTWIWISMGKEREYQTASISHFPYLGIERVGPMLAVPGWLIILATAVLPAIWFRRVRKHKSTITWQSHLLCVHCGYDLRATPDRCPECGRDVLPA
jgi:hypothetical protein